MPKISALDTITSPDDLDQLPINDVSAVTTKKITLAGLITWLQTKVGYIVTAMLANAAVTTSKLKPNSIRSAAAGGFTVQGARWTYASGVIAQVPGCSMNYTSGATAERLFLKMEVMAMCTPGNGEVQLYVDSTPQLPRIYVDPSASWVRHGQTYVIDVPANTTIALSVRGFAVAGSTLHVTNETANWMPSLNGFAISNA